MKKSNFILLILLILLINSDILAQKVPRKRPPKNPTTTVTTDGNNTGTPTSTTVPTAAYKEIIERGTTFAKQGNGQKAIAEFDKAILMSPNEGLGYAKKANAQFYLLGNKIEAEKNYEISSQKGYKDPTTFLEWGDCIIQVPNPKIDKFISVQYLGIKEANILINGTEKKAYGQEKLPIFYGNIALAYLRNDEADKALGIVDEGYKASGLTTHFFLDDMKKKANATKISATGIEGYNKIVGRGIDFSNQGNSEKAIAEFDKAILMFPNEGFAYGRKANTQFYVIKNKSEAEKTYEISTQKGYKDLTNFLEWGDCVIQQTPEPNLDKFISIQYLGIKEANIMINGTEQKAYGQEKLPIFYGNIAMAYLKKNDAPKALSITDEGYKATGLTTHFFLDDMKKQAKVGVLNIELINSSNIVQTPLGELKKNSFAVEGTPSDALGTQSSQARRFYLMQSPTGEVESIWQDIKTKEIYLTKFNKNLTTSQNILLPSTPNANILGATNDNEGNYYYVVVTLATSDAINDFITVHKADKQGKIILSKIQNSANTELNINRVGGYPSTLRHKDGTLAFMMGRVMNIGGDGSNHQGGAAVFFDAQTLLVTYNFGQTSGHSFDNFLEPGRDNKFIAIDLGDNYPRGINLHKFTKGTTTSRNSRVVYTFKTYHGNTASGGGKENCPLYEEISTPTDKHYKWSNDNGTYTELGGVIEVNDGYCVIFAGEHDTNGKSMNSIKIGEKNNDPRNLGFVKVRKDFERGSLKEIMLSQGISEKSGFYNFTGNWNEQENEGVTWLTKYRNTDTESVRNMKTVLLPNGNILVLYVKSKRDNWHTVPSDKAFMMCLSPNGAIVIPETDLGSGLRLNRRDEILVIGNQVFIIQGREADKKLELFVLNLK